MSHVREMYERLVRAQVAMDADAFAAVFAADGVLEFPFTRPGVPQRRAGRELIRSVAQQGWAAAAFRFEQVSGVQLYPTTDPELLIAEHQLTGLGTENGRPFTFPFLVLLRVRDGEVVLLREYLNVVAIAEATDRLQDLAADVDADTPWQAGIWPGESTPPPEPMVGARRPRDVYARYQHAVLAHSADGIADLFAPEGLKEYPFAMPGLPARFEGREQIRAGLSGLFGRTIRFEDYRNVRIHECADPEVIVVEHDIAGVVVASGRPHLMSYVYVIRVRDGQIVHLRDYVNPLAAARAAGGLTALLSRIPS